MRKQHQESDERIRTHRGNGIARSDELVVVVVHERLPLAVQLAYIYTLHRNREETIHTIPNATHRSEARSLSGAASAATTS